MSSIKQTRGQLRQIAKEILPEVLASELVLLMREEQNKRLDALVAAVNKRLDDIEKRSKDVQSYIMREVANATAPRDEK